MSTSSTAVTAVLWDADGVLQQVPSSWFELLDQVLGKQESLALLDLLLPQVEAAIRGDVAMSERLPAALTERGLGEHVERICEVWGTIDRLEESREFVRRLRERGIGCHLATNQDDLRTSYMRARMGYDDLLDRCFYSCELGVAKPDVAFFRRVAEELEVELGALVFVDDTLENVRAAQSCGLPAFYWHHRDGIDTLGERLAELGVEVS
jgi:putative hydrolase of the HAD superfamily